jgi:hypothetical protein
MAFHPLRTFQKHRKAWLAGITIMTMFIFVFSFSASPSGGDFFDFMTRLFGAEGRAGPEIARLYGERLNHRDLVQVRERRILANTFMEMAVEQAHQNLIGRATEVTAKWEEIPKQEIGRVLSERNFRMALARNPQFAAQLQPAEMVNQIRQGLTRLNFLRQDLVEKKKTDEERMVGRLMAVLDYESQRWQRANEPFYFGGSTRLDSVLDFMIWKHEADQLGVRLTEADVKEVFDRETLQQLRREDSAALEKRVLQGRQGTSFRQLLDALTDEFRVRIARASILGYDPSASTQIPAPITPHEFYEFFKNVRTESSVALLPFPVKDFVPLVKETPTEEQLKELFEKYKDKEYRPDSPTPGFKQPRRVTVEWVSARPDSPHYKRAAEVATAATHAINPAALHAQLVDYYDRNEKYRYPLPALTEPLTALPFYTDGRRPENAAATLGLLSGAAATPATVLPAVLSHQASLVARADKTAATAAQRESQRRAPVAATFVLAGANPTPVSLVALWHHASRQPQYQSLDAVREEIVKRVRENLARELLLKGLDTLRKDLEARRGRPEEAAKKVAEYVKRYGLEHGKTQQPRDLYDIGSDPGMKALKDSYLRVQGGQDQRGRAFGMLFLDNARLFEGQPWPRDVFGRGFGENWMTTAEPFLFWKTTDRPAYEPKFEEVRAKVEEAWRFDKARALALQEAQEMAAKAKQKEKETVAILSQGSKHSGTLFTLDSVSLLKPQMQFRLGPSRQYQAYQVPDTLVDYPGGDFVPKLLTLDKRDEVIVLSDRPEAHYYVAGLVNRRPPSVEDFFLVYRNAPAASLQSDPLLSRLEQDRQQRYYQACMEQLRAEAKLTVAKDGRKQFDERDDTPVEEL